MELAYCGLDCTTCSVYQATVTDDDALRAQCAREWQGTASEHWGLAELRPEQMSCRGCQCEEPPQFLSCQRCPIRSCARGRGFSSCADCAEWTTCGRLSGLLADVPDARANLQRLSAVR